MNAPVELDRDRLRALLAELDARMRERGIAVGLYIVGGAAIALTIAERRVTVDVDALALALGMGDADGAAFEQLLRNAYGDDETLEMALGIRRDEDLDTEVTHRGRDTCRIVQQLSGWSTRS